MQATNEDENKELENPAKPPLKIEVAEISKDDPWRNDALARKEMAVALTNLVKPESSPLVVTLNGGWGTGKTFFLERWKAHLEQEGVHAICFNAWEDDYSVDPLVAIIGQLCDEFKDKKYKGQVDRLKKAGVNISKKLALKGLGALTCGLMNLTEEEIRSGKDTFSEVLKVLSEADPGENKSTRDRLFDEYRASREGREELKLALKSLTKEVRNDSKAPLVFIIDELDRCRPTFAIELLERIKHLFGIENMVFVLGIDRGQLGNSVRSVYGDIDVDGYLRRFFDMEFSLPPLKPGIYCSHLLEKHGVDEYLQYQDNLIRGNAHRNAYDTIGKILPFLCQQLNLSLRDMESLIRRYVFVIRNLNGTHNRWPQLLSILLILQLNNHELYSRFVGGKIGAKDVLDHIESHYGNFDLDRRDADFRISCWIAAITYVCIPKTFSDRSQVFAELEQFRASEKDPRDYQHISKRSLKLGRKERECFFEAYDHERNQANMSDSSPEMAINKLLRSIELK